MTKKLLNSILIEEIKIKANGSKDLAVTLMNTLCIGKEAVYRRLRGEVPFTLEEAALIARKMDISIDKLASSGMIEDAVFDFSLKGYEDPYEAYNSMLDSSINAVRRMTGDSYSRIDLSTGIIPEAFYMKYELLSKLKFLKWLYQHDRVKFAESVCSSGLPHDLRNKQAEYVNESQNFSFSRYLWDDTLFHSTVNDIKYFAGINLISKEETEGLKNELMQLITQLEATAVKGKLDNGNEVQFYVSDVNIDAAYCCMENITEKLVILKFFGMNSVMSFNANIFHDVKNWILSLKKFSTLISQSGEVQRIRFFNRQRFFVSDL